MGKGNQFIRNRDGYGVRTFYFDPYGDFEEEKKAYVEQKREDLAEELSGLGFAERRRKVEQMMMSCRLPVRVKDETIWARINENAEDEIDNLGYEVGGKDGIPGFTRRKKREFEECLAAGNRESGFVIAESDNCQVVIADNECNVAIACIPADSRYTSDENVRDDKYDSLYAEAEAQLEKTVRDKEFGPQAEDIEKIAEANLKALQEKKWEEYLEKFKADANAAMRKIHEFFGTQSISERDGAWMSSRLKQYDELTEEERNNYY